MTIKEVSEKYNISQDTLRYYERVGMIPQVHRTGGGIRDYQQDDLSWVELAICMRSAGLPVEVMIKYVRLYMQGDSTIPARLQLLLDQKSHWSPNGRHAAYAGQIGVQDLSLPGGGKNRQAHLGLTKGGNAKCIWKRSTALPM